MWYSIVGQDVPDSLALRKQFRPDHLARLQQLYDQGRLLAAGPNPAVDSEQPTDAGFTGSIMIVDFETLEQAQAWANDDPYRVGGVFASVEVKPFIQVFPKA